MTLFLCSNLNYTNKKLCNEIISLHSKKYRAEKRQIPNFEVYVDGKKDEELTVKAKKALEFIKRYDEVAGNQLSILDWDSELLNCYFDNFEKSMKDKFFDKK